MLPKHIYCQTIDPHTTAYNHLQARVNHKSTSWFDRLAGPIENTVQAGMTQFDSLVENVFVRKC